MTKSARGGEEAEFAEKQPYIIERNKILDTWRYYLPFYQRKLSEIDQKLDEIEMRYYKPLIDEPPKAEDV